MKICIVSLNIAPYFERQGGPGYGGAEVQAAVLARALSQSGQDVTLVVADGDRGGAIPFHTETAFRSDEGIPALRFFYPRLWGIQRALARSDADVYYQHCAGMITGVTALFCRSRSRIFVYGAGSNTDFSFRTPRLSSFRDRVLYYTGLKLADGIAVQNRLQQELCLRNVKKRARVLPMGIAVDGFGRAQSGDAVLWIGGIRRVKRPELFLELARRLPEFKFIMVGGAAPSEAAFSRRIVENARELPNLEMTGRIPHADALDRLSRAALLVNTSRVEGFPNVYLEAWKSGVPVVSFTDVDDLIKGENVGVLCGTVDDMASKVSELLNDPVRLGDMGARAVDLIKRRFAPEVIAREYVAFFKELLERRRQRRRVS